MHLMAFDSAWNSSPATAVSRRSARRARISLAAATAALLGVAALLPGPAATIGALLHSGPRPADGQQVVDTAALSVAALVVWAVLAWIALVGLVALTSRSARPWGAAARRTLTRIAPRAVRQVVLTVVGASMVTGLAACGTGPASAASVPAQATHLASIDSALRGVPVAVPAGGRAAVEAGPGAAAQAGAGARGDVGGWIAVEGSAVHSPLAAWLPPGAQAAAKAAAGADPPDVRNDRSSIGRSVPSTDWPSDRTPAAPDAHPIDLDWPTTTDAASGGTVVVLRGDSLWSIAAAHLPAGAGPAAIDTAWRAWYQANKSVIGSDPDLLLPGQILRPPPGTSS